jgi:hypothetical protein
MIFPLRGPRMRIVLQISAMKVESVARPMQGAPDGHCGSGIAPADARYVGAALRIDFHHFRHSRALGPNIAVAAGELPIVSASLLGRAYPPPGLSLNGRSTWFAFASSCSGSEPFVSTRDQTANDLAKHLACQSLMGGRRSKQGHSAGRS